MGNAGRNWSCWSALPQAGCYLKEVTITRKTPQTSAYYSTKIAGKGRCLQNPGMSYQNAPPGLRSEQQNELLCVQSLLHTEDRVQRKEAYSSLKLVVGHKHLCFFPYSIYSICHLAMGINQLQSLSRPGQPQDPGVRRSAALIILLAKMFREALNYQVNNSWQLNNSTYLPPVSFLVKTFETVRQTPL